ncbi:MULTISPECIES: RDD family protein [Shewanella]|uniref:RDD family protein n=1 Tax=Shewanella fidelis TaxID=173509 RepID=A0AAW8NP25_9GAMM|nr:MULTISPECIES: RDD family protein [Shewanella]MDR8524912.1 RDD family protein [Shewanella fidelis]MDW4810983.1 RDD family protein [Shewanella fidelis]MDW4815238.1 RDD family protein [Shewanella fidelis]MDW4819328.1 RDD family protein [Shewanella fidelis]MDW4822994.1 RDD family protein [Shewanella fidelis]
MTTSYLPNNEHANFPRAGFIKRFGAIVYDLMLAVAVYMVAGAIGFGIFTGLTASGIIDMAGFEHVSDLLNGTPLYKGIYQFWIVMCVGLFYISFWSYGGQTLGMRAWRLKIQHPNGQNLSMITAAARLVWSLLGIGNLWILINGNKLALQDMMTRSEVVVLSKEANQMRNWRGV